MLAQLLSSGMGGGSQNWGQVIGNLAKQFVGQRGLKQQGRLRMEEQEQASMEQEQQKKQQYGTLAQLMGGDFDHSAIEALSQNPKIAAQIFGRRNTKDDRNYQQGQTEEQRRYTEELWQRRQQEAAALKAEGREQELADRMAEWQREDSQLGEGRTYDASQQAEQREYDASQLEEQREYEASIVKTQKPADVTAIRALAGDWHKATRPVRSLKQQLTIMQTGLNAARNGDMNAGSQAVLVTFQKILDETSVVRESEYARSGTGLSLMGRLEGQFTKISQGGAGVTVEDLESFERLASEFVENASRDYVEAERTRISDLSDYAGIDHKYVFGYDPYEGKEPPTEPDASTTQIDPETLSPGNPYRDRLLAIRGKN